MAKVAPLDDFEWGNEPPPTRHSKVSAQEAAGDSDKDFSTEKIQEQLKPTMQRLYKEMAAKQEGVEIDKIELWNKKKKHEFEHGVLISIQDQQKLRFTEADSKIEGLDVYTFYDAGDGPWRHFDCYIPVRNPFTIFDPATTSQAISKTDQADDHINGNTWKTRTMREGDYPEKFIHFPPQNVRIIFLKGVFEKYHGVKRFTRLSVLTHNVDKEATKISDCQDRYEVDIDVAVAATEKISFDTAGIEPFPQGFKWLSGTTPLEQGYKQVDTPRDGTRKDTFRIKTKQIQAKHIFQRVVTGDVESTMFPIDDSRSWGQNAPIDGEDSSDGTSKWWDIQSPAEFLFMGINDVTKTIKNMNGKGPTRSNKWNDIDQNLKNLFEEILIFGKRMGDANQPLIAAVFRVFLDLGLIKHGRANEFGEFIEGLNGSDKISNIYVGDEEELKALVNSVFEQEGEPEIYLIELCNFGEKLFVVVTNNDGNPIPITDHARDTINQRYVAKNSGGGVDMKGGMNPRAPIVPPPQAPIVPPPQAPFPVYTKDERNIEKFIKHRSTDDWIEELPKQIVATSTCDYALCYLSINAVQIACMIMSSKLWREWLINSDENITRIEHNKKAEKCIKKVTGLCNTQVGPLLVKKVKLFFNTMEPAYLDYLNDKQQIDEKIVEMTEFKKAVEHVFDKFIDVENFKDQIIAPPEESNLFRVGWGSGFRKLQKPLDKMSKDEDEKYGYFTEWKLPITTYLQEYLDILGNLSRNLVDFHDPSKIQDDANLKFDKRKVLMKNFLKYIDTNVWNKNAFATKVVLKNWPKGLM
tara:strand:+ start:17 stop:2434 length:2418 start_codon:yes stop_codon:yes gene_type:complete